MKNFKSFIAESKVQFEVPEEWQEDANEFITKASAAHKAGKKSFSIGGKEYPVTIKKPINELGKATLARYTRNASQDAAQSAYKAGEDGAEGGKNFSKSMKRLKGIQTATHKLAMKKEEVEIEESMKPPFAPPYNKIDKKKPATNSDGSVTSGISKARQLAKQAIKNATKKEEMTPDQKDDRLVMIRKAAEKVRAQQAKMAKKAERDAKRQMANEAVEDDQPASPDEKGMADSQLNFIIYAAKEIQNYVVSEGVEFPEWFQNKLTGAYTTIKDMHAYMEGENTDMAEEFVFESLAAAKELRAYADKHGGIDKKDFHKAADHIENVHKADILSKSAHLEKLNNHVRGMDTDPRDKVHQIIKKHSNVKEDIQYVLENVYFGTYNKRGDRDKGGVVKSKENMRKVFRDLAAKRDARMAAAKNEENLDEEQLDELSPKTLKSYVRKNHDSMSGNPTQRDPKKFEKRSKGLQAAGKRLSKHNPYSLYDNHKDFDKAHKDIHSAVTKAKGMSDKKAAKAHVGAAMKKHAHVGAQDTASREQIHRHAGISEAVGTAAKYADRKGMFGGKYSSHDHAITTKNFGKYRDDRSKKRDAEHKAQDPKMAKMGYAKHMVDTKKAAKKANARGVSQDAIRKNTNWKNTNGVAKGKLPESSDQAKANKMKKNAMDAARGAKYKIDNKLSGDAVRDWDGKHKTPQQQNKAIGRALRKEDINEIFEKLSHKDDMGKWITDFQSSDAPQFKGKSKEEIRKMAIAAKLDADREAGKSEGFSFEDYINVNKNKGE